jgi:putative colanic acid biosynthesis acetyltransferase WcaF
MLTMFGAKLGKHVHIYPGARIWAPWNLEVGSNVGIADGAIIYNMAKIQIGNYAVISQGAHLCTGSHDYNAPNFQLTALPITVGNYVWICADAFLAPGVEVPEGAVIGARAVVPKTLKEPWTVYAGTPARRIRKRARSGETI